jgi:hypothetical protein
MTNPPNSLGSSAAAESQKRYSAKELGEMMNTHPDQLFCIDIAACTDWFTNDDYMEEMLSYVHDEERIDGLIQILRTTHRYLLLKGNPKICYRVKDERKWAPYVEDLNEKLCAMRIRILQYREVKAELEEMKLRWSKASMSTSEAISANSENTDNTQPPSFTNSSGGENVQYHLSDLPQNVSNKILITTDEVYSEFVDTLKGPVNNWIAERRKQDWNVVRFICILRGIVARKCSTPIFANLLEIIGLGKQYDIIKKRKDANDPSALIAYDSPLCSDDPYQDLRNDGKEVEALLEATIKKMAA